VAPGLGYGLDGRRVCPFNATNEKIVSASSKEIQDACRGPRSLPCELLLHARKEQVSAGSKSEATFRFYREKIGHWLRVLGEDFPTGSVHLLTLPLEKRCVPPPSAKGHDQAMASAKGGSEKPRLALYAIDSALTYSVFRRVQSHGRT
jgi:hypothetical protein